MLKSFKMSSILMVLISSFMTFTQADSPANQFLIATDKFDDLSGKSDCQTLLSSKIALVFCEDGYVGIDPAIDFLRMARKNDKNQAALKLNLGSSGGPRDVQLSTYLTMIDSSGEFMSVIRSQDYSSHTLSIDRSNELSAQFLGGFFTNRYIVVWIQQSHNGPKFIQVHSASRNVELVAAIEEQVESYAVYDQLETKGILQVFAKRSANGGNWLGALTMTDSYNLAHYQDIKISNDQCGDSIEVSESMVVMACQHTKLLTIFRRSNMEQIGQKYFTGVDGDVLRQIAIVSREKGSQQFVFYTIDKGYQSKLGMLEILLNENAGSQLQLDHGIQSFPDQTRYNYGQLSISSGSRFLLVNFDDMDQIYGYTICGYSQTLNTKDNQSCKPLARSTFSINPFTSQTVPCQNKIIDSHQKSKMDFLCQMYSNSDKLFEYIALGLVGTGAIMFIISIVVMVRARKELKETEMAINIQVVASRPQVQQQRQRQGAGQGAAPAAPVVPQMTAEERERLEQQQLKDKMTLIASKLKKLKYKSSKHKQNQDSCCICVEDFMPDGVVRETPCNHLFHDECLMKWIETKIKANDAADCPFCRTELKIF